MIQDHGHPHTVEVKVHIFLPSTETKRWLYNSIMLNLTNMMVIPTVCRGLKEKRDGMNKAITWHSVKMLNSNIPVPQRKLIRNSVILTGTPIYTSQNTAPLPTPGQIIQFPNYYICHFISKKFLLLPPRTVESIFAIMKNVVFALLLTVCFFKLFRVLL